MKTPGRNLEEVAQQHRLVKDRGSAYSNKPEPADCPAAWEGKEPSTGLLQQQQNHPGKSVHFKIIKNSI